jgi:hypothetical protein
MKKIAISALLFILVIQGCGPGAHLTIDKIDPEFSKGYIDFFYLQNPGVDFEVYSFENDHEVFISKMPVSPLFAKHRSSLVLAKLPGIYTFKIKYCSTVKGVFQQLSVLKIAVKEGMVTPVMIDFLRTGPTTKTVTTYKVVSQIIEPVTIEMWRIENKWNEYWATFR